MTSTVPVPAGLSAVIVVSLTTVTLVAGVVPKSTAVAPVKPVPVIVTDGAAGGRTAGRAQAGDGRCGRRGVGELIGGGSGRGAGGCGHGDVHGAGACGAVGGDRGVVDHGEVGRGRGAEVDGGGAGEARCR